MLQDTKILPFPDASLIEVDQPPEAKQTDCLHNGQTGYPHKELLGH